MPFAWFIFDAVTGIDHGPDREADRWASRGGGGAWPAAGWARTRSAAISTNRTLGHARETARASLIPCPLPSALAPPGSGWLTAAATAGSVRHDETGRNGNRARLPGGTGHLADTNAKRPTAGVAARDETRP